MSENKYLSKYFNGKYVTAAQFITEMICERLAKKDKRDLHYRFWLSDDWQKSYKNQIPTANKLLKKYSAKAIIDALCSPTGKKIYSLRAPHLTPIIEQIELKLKQQPVVEIKPIQRNMLDVGSVSKKSKNLIDKLKELE